MSGDVEFLGGEDVVMSRTAGEWALASLSCSMCMAKIAVASAYAKYMLDSSREGALASTNNS